MDGETVGTLSDARPAQLLSISAIEPQFGNLRGTQSTRQFR